MTWDGRSATTRTDDAPPGAALRAWQPGVQPAAVRRSPAPGGTALMSDQERAHRSILEVTHLCVHYGSKKAVDDVSFAINHGEIFGLLGPNGAGKTSTLSAIEGLVTPQSGALLLDGMDMRRHRAAARANLGVQLQSTSFQPELTIDQLIKLYADLYNVRLSAAEVRESLGVIGLESESGK